MTEHFQSVCPSCGEPAANYRFCPWCGMNIGSLPESPARTQWEAGGASEQVAQDPVQPLTFGRLSSAGRGPLRRAVPTAGLTPHGIAAMGCAARQP